MYNKIMKNTLPAFVYIICNGIFIEKCAVIRETRDFVTMRIVSTGQGLRVRRSKIYLTEKEAKLAVTNKTNK